MSQFYIKEHIIEINDLTQDEMLHFCFSNFHLFFPSDVKLETSR